MKTYLVTGCAGFIGSNFVHYMLEKYCRITRRSAMERWRKIADEGIE